MCGTQREWPCLLWSQWLCCVSLCRPEAPWLAPRTRYRTALSSFLHPEVPWCNVKPGGDAGTGPGRSVAVGLLFPCTRHRGVPRGTVTHRFAGLGPERGPLGAVCDSVTMCRGWHPAGRCQSVVCVPLPLVLAPRLPSQGQRLTFLCAARLLMQETACPWVPVCVQRAVRLPRRAGFGLTAKHAHCVCLLGRCGLL